MIIVYLSAVVGGIIAAARCFCQRWAQRAAFHFAVLQHGCQQPPQYPHQDLWGYDLYRDRLESTARGEGYKLYQRHFAAYGKTFEEQFLSQKTITTMEVANYQHVLGLGAKDFSKEEPAHKRRVVEKFLGRGILTTTGAEWKQHRTLVTPIFSRGELADVTILGKHVDRLMSMLPRDERTIDVHDFLHKMFLDVSSENLLGNCFNALDPKPSKETTAFLDTFEKANAGLAQWRSAPRLKYLRYFLPNDYDKACKTLHKILDRYVARSLCETTSSTQHISSEKPSEPERIDRSERYIFLNELAKRIRDPATLRAEVGNIFFVARDNPAAVTSNALFQLARNPSMWAELRKTALEIGNQPLTFDLLRSLPPFIYVWRETLRMQGPSIPSVRVAIRNSILPTGGGSDGKAPIFVEKGTKVLCNNWSMHHDKDIWGDDAEEFKPDRWAGRKPSMWEFVPFGGGPRICPAIQQVYTYFLYVMVRLAQEFEGIQNRDPVEEYVTNVRLTLESRNGVKIALIPATSQVGE